MANNCVKLLQKVSIFSITNSNIFYSNIQADILTTALVYYFINNILFFKCVCYLLFSDMLHNEDSCKLVCDISLGWEKLLVIFNVNFDKGGLYITVFNKSVVYVHITILLVILFNLICYMTIFIKKLKFLYPWGERDWRPF